MINAIRNEAATLINAIQFLTRIPIPANIEYSADRLAASTRYYPAVGILIGIAVAIIYWITSLALPPIAAALISTGVGLLITGAFHEDGLADTFDGIGGAHDRQRALEIMKDSRIGTFGTLALLIVIGTKVAAIASMPNNTAIAALVIAHSLSRSAIVLTITTSKYASKQGLGSIFANRLNPTNLIVAMTISAIPMIIATLTLSLAMPTIIFAICGAIAGYILIRLYYQPKLHGYTGDTLGATQQTVELGIYIAITASAAIITS